jgi:hypothetical protein
MKEGTEEQKVERNLRSINPSWDFTRLKPLEILEEKNKKILKRKYCTSEVEVPI